MKQAFVEARKLRMDLHVVPDLYDGLGWRAPVHFIGGFPLLKLYGESIPAVGLAVKRLMDVVLSSIGLVLTAPLLALAGLCIRLDSAGSAIYTPPRVGKKGKKFNCYKLRGMVMHANTQKNETRGANERQAPFFKIEKDPRITRCGRWQRKFSADEVPQLVNVLLGDMSLVGPRPHPLDDYERYTIEHLRRLDVKPGIKGLWQVTARRHPSFETSMALDLEYIENWSLRLDLKILMRTVQEVGRANGRQEGEWPLDSARGKRVTPRSTGKTKWRGQRESPSWANRALRMVSLEDLELDIVVVRHHKRNSQIPRAA